MMDLLKYASLVALTLQKTILDISMKYARSREGDKFLIGTAVLMAEVAKLIICLILVFIAPNEGGRDIKKFSTLLYRTIIVNKYDTLKVCVPSFLYLIQNSLLYVGVGHLNVVTFQITCQTKIFTTAIFSVLILKRHLRATQWISLLLLSLGVALVNMPDPGKRQDLESDNDNDKSLLIGFGSVLMAMVLSGLAGVYFEKILKGAVEISVWMRNIQLSLLSLPLGLIMSFTEHYEDIQEKGFFFGYDLFVIYLILFNAMGGVLVGVVVKYADMIIKGFSFSISIVLTCLVSIVFFQFEINRQIIVGACLVFGSTFLYSYQPRKISVKAATTVAGFKEESIVLPIHDTNKK